MKENWRQTLPNPATNPGRSVPTHEAMREEYERATQRDRARQMDARMRQALADGEGKKNGRKWLVGILVALLIFGGAFGLSVARGHFVAPAETEQETGENPWDGSQAGANAVTLEDIKAGAEAKDDYEESWRKVDGYTVSWDIVASHDDVTIAGASDGPIYDLPIGWTSFTVHDKATNRSYTVIVNDVGSFYVMPSLDEDGDQIITERY